MLPEPLIPTLGTEDLDAGSNFAWGNIGVDGTYYIPQSHLIH